MSKSIPSAIERALMAAIAKHQKQIDKLEHDLANPPYEQLYALQLELSKAMGDPKLSSKARLAKFNDLEPQIATLKRKAQSFNASALIDKKHEVISELIELQAALRVFRQGLFSYEVERTAYDLRVARLQQLRDKQQALQEAAENATPILPVP